MKPRFLTIVFVFLTLLSLDLRPKTADAQASGGRLAQEQPSTTPVWKVEGSDDGFNLGAPVSGAGDVNGDGYADVMVGIPLSGIWKLYEGSVQLYFGSAAGMSPSPVWSASGGQSGANFGHSIDCAGDVNGDGYSDIIIGAPKFANGDTGEGRVSVYYGSPSGLKGAPDWTAETNHASDNFGFSVSGAGDMNGDGYDDVVVGAPGYDRDATTGDQGRIYLYYGSPDGLQTAPDWTYSPEQPGLQLGKTLSSAGDVNGDGYDDVLVSDDGGGGDGRTMLFSGRSGGPENSPDWTVEGGREVYYFDQLTAGGMDVNGDGYSDVIVGGMRIPNTFQSIVNGYYGSPDGPAVHPDWTVEGDDQGAFGRSVSSAGDFNGDGYDDIIIGAPTYSNGEYSEGKVYVYYGSAQGLRYTPGWAVEGNVEGAWFGANVGAVGEGTTDLIIGAPQYSNQREYENGAAFLFRGAHPGFHTYLPLTIDEIW